MNKIERRMFASESVQVSGLKDGFAAQRKWPLKYQSIEFISVLADFSAISFAAITASAIFSPDQFGQRIEIHRCIGAAMVVSASFVPLMKNLGMYEVQKITSQRNYWFTISSLWAGVLLLLSLAAAALGMADQQTYGTAGLFAILGLLELIAWRSLWRILLLKGIMLGRLSGRNIVLISQRARSSRAGLAALLERHGYNLQHQFILPPTSAGRGKRDQVIDDVISHAKSSGTEEIIIVGDSNDWHDLRRVVNALRVLPVPVSFVPQGVTAEIFASPIRRVGTTVCVQLERGPLSPIDRGAKRCFDVLAAGTALLALLPLLMIVAVAIKMDSPGPIFFKQRRGGFNGNCFRILKFRSMSVLDDGASIAQAQRDDDRTTRVGKWLRRTSIDELPQLINVLEGSMSLIGPRPHAVAHDTEFEQLVSDYAKRRRVKPGITGWAQVNGCRGATPTLASIERRTKLDLWYIDNWSLGLDLKLIFLTALEVARGRNAY